MPYRAELHFMYLFLRTTLEREFPGLTCERADKQAMTGLLKDKIARSINAADVIIADCTGANPNVFYELGMAHALGKETILLTADGAEATPTDLRAYEFIGYRLDDELSLQTQLTRALHSILHPTENDYDWAKNLLADYTRETHTALTAVSQEEFDLRIESKLKPGETPARRASILLSEVIDDRLTIEDARTMGDWIEARFAQADQVRT
jgi:nucleoside 2-deoxyribosyltransferase